MSNNARRLAISIYCMRIRTISELRIIFIIRGARTLSFLIAGNSREMFRVIFSWNWIFFYIKFTEIKIIRIGVYACFILRLGINLRIFATVIFLYVCSETNSIKLNNNFTEKFY